MYQAYKTYTLTCPADETGGSWTASASAASIISQTDADNKALELAQHTAQELLVCSFPPGTQPTIYLSVSKTATVYNTAGYQTQSFVVTLPAGSVYSLVSQAAADNAAVVAANAQAVALRNATQKPLWQNRAQTWSGSCAGSFVPFTSTITVAANTFTSTVSQSDADQAALASAKSQVAAALSAGCTVIYYSVTQTYTDTCSGGTVGAPITVTNPAGYSTSSVSQAAANAASLAAATATATSLRTASPCASGYWNTAQSYTATCLAQFGAGWVGSNSSFTQPANTYYSTVSQAAANASALTYATGRAQAALVCTYSGGYLP